MFNRHGISGISSSVNRRQFLGASSALALSAVAVGTTGCQVQTSSDPQGNASQAAYKIEIPDSGADLPTGEVTIRWMSGGPGAKSEVFKALFPAYEKKNSNITVQYDELPNDKIKEVLPLQIRNNNAADVFQVIGVPLAEIVAGEKLAALEDVVPGFDEWAAAMPFGVLVPGINQFDGKTYSLPASGNKLISSLLLYSTDQMEAVGYDPKATPLTLESFRDIAKKLTSSGDGDSFGFLIGGKDGGTMSATVTELAQLNGGTPALDYKTGKYNNSQDAIVEVIEMFKAMLDEGSFFPGWASLSEQEARAQMPLGRGGMMLQGAWNFPVWKGDFPDFSFGVAAPPMPSDHGYVAVGTTGNGYAVPISAPDDHKAIAGDLLHFLGSPEGQELWARYDGSADPAWNTDVVEKLRESPDLSQHDKDAFAVFDEVTRIGPQPVIANPDQQQVQLNLKQVQPALGSIVQGYLTGQIDNLKTALKELDVKSEAALDEAIIAAKKKTGAEVSRDDWVFPNWDPSKDFGEADYQS